MTRAAGSRGPVLVLRALGLGDFLTGLPALRGIRRACPARKVVLAAPPALGQLIPLSGAVDEVWPTADLRSFEWGATAPELAVNLHGSGPQSIAALLATGARRVWTHAHPEFPSVPGPRWVVDQHEVSRWTRMLGHRGVDADPAELGLDKPGDAGRPGRTVVHPGASTAARRWPPERFAELARGLAQRGADVVVTGGASERHLAESVARSAGLPPDAALAGRTDLRELAGLIADARLVVSGDTGVAHLASAYATPSVVLFGPVAPRHWGPPNRQQHVVLWNGTTGDTFADHPDSGLLNLSVREVARGCESALLRSQPAAAGGDRG